MVQNQTEGLHFLTYVALLILATVIFLYLRQRRDHDRQVDVQLYTSIRHIPIVKPNPSNSLFQEPGTNLPTFSAQEVIQRKMPRQIDHSEIDRRNLSAISDFGNKISNYEPLFADKGQLNTQTDKIFGDNKKSYEPSRLTASPPIASPKAWKPGQTPDINFRSPKLISPKGLSNNNGEGIIQTIQVVKEEVFAAPGGQNIQENIDSNIEKRQSLEIENEYSEIQKPDRRNLDEFPVEGLSQVDRSGLSLESPLRMLESPMAIESKKKLNNQRDQDRNRLNNKPESLARTQDPSTQKRGPREQIPQSQRSTQNKLQNKKEKKVKRNQFFLDNESDDGMIIEDIRDPHSKNKRTANDSRSVDVVEKEISSRKYLKDNSSQQKILSTKTKNISLDRSDVERLDKSITDSSKISGKKNSLVDLSYISEHGVNSSMRRYVEKKNMRNNDNLKSNTFTPLSAPKRMAIEDKPNKDPFFSKSQEKPSLFSTQSPLGPSSSNTKPNNFLFTTRPAIEAAPNQKSAAPAKESDKLLEEEKPTLFQGSKNGFDKKKEEEDKAITKPTQFSSLFSQPKPVDSEIQPSIKPNFIFSQPTKVAEPEPSTSLFKQTPASVPDKIESSSTEKVESPKQTDLPKQSSPQTENKEPGKIDLFSKPSIPEGGIFASKDEGKNQEEKEEKPKNNIFGGPSTSSFSFGIKKPDIEVSKSQDEKTESKPLLPAATGGLFGNLTGATSFGSSSNGLKATKLISNSEEAPPGLFKLNSDPPAKGAMQSISLFGSGFNKPKEEVGSLGLQRSSSLVQPDVSPKADVSSEDKKPGLFNTLLSQKRDINSIFGGTKTEERKEGSPTTSFGMFSTPNNTTLFKSSSSEPKNLELPQKSDPLGSYSQMPEGVKPSGGIFGQKTEQPLVGFPSNPTGNLFGQRDSSKKKDDPLANFAKNPVVESSKKAEDPLASYSQNPTGNLFGKRADSPKKADKPSVGEVKNPTGNIFGSPTSQKKSEGLFGNMQKPAGEDNKGFSSIFGNSGVFGNSSQAKTANGGATGFSSIFKTDGKTQGGFFSNLGSNNANNNEKKCGSNRK